MPERQNTTVFVARESVMPFNANAKDSLNYQKDETKLVNSKKNDEIFGRVK